jgi:predicted ATPase
MRLRSLSFAGYRSFAARSPAAPDRPLQRLQLAPLTILLGKNNSGKSTAARLLHHVLLALGHDGKDPFPMVHEGYKYGSSFRDVQHGGAFFNPLDLEAELSAEDGTETTLTAQLIQLSDSADDRPPVVNKLSFGGKAFAAEESPPRGLLPNVPEASTWREGARRLLEMSCHLGPVRDSIRDMYEVDRNATERRIPNNSDAVAQLLLADDELRASVVDWMEEHLEGWRVDVQQSLEVFNLMARRGARESNLAASGQGIQQVLPVAALCCWRSLDRGSAPFLDIIEQPELHLHDAAHAPIGDLLLSAVAGGRGTLVVETHSESLVLRVRRRVAEGLSPDRVAIVYVEDTGEGSRLRSIPLRPDGEAEWWPEGVFSEAFVEVKAIRRAQRSRGGG